MTSSMCLYTAICNSFDKIRIFSLSYFPVLLGSCLAVINIWKYFIFISIWRRWSQLLFSPLLICLTDYETDEWPLAALFNFQIHLKAIFTSDKKISELIKSRSGLPEITELILFILFSNRSHRYYICVPS